MLDSLLPQLSVEDYVTVLFHGHMPKEFDYSKAICHIHVETVIEHAPCQPQHTIRNKTADSIERTTFVMHADDDDIYVDGAFDSLRSLCLDESTLYIAKMQDNVKQSTIPWYNKIERNNIGTPCGIIPYALNQNGTWTNEPAGDAEFYVDIARIAEKIEFLQLVIYIIRPT
jgi:hypothetical protein